MTAFVFPVTASSRREGSRLNVLGSMSTKTGTAPSRPTTSAVAMKVKGVVMTSSPVPIPRARSASSRASVPLATPTACGTPWYRATSASSADTLGPSINWVLSSTSRTAASISALSCRYCRRRSTMGIIA